MASFVILWALSGHALWLLPMCDDDQWSPWKGKPNLPEVVSFMWLSWVLGPVLWLLVDLEIRKKTTVHCFKIEV